MRAVVEPDTLCVVAKILKPRREIFGLFKLEQLNGREEGKLGL